MARFEAGGGLSLDVRGEDVRVADEGMRAAPSDTLWSCYLTGDAPRIRWTPPASSAMLRLLLATTAIPPAPKGGVAPFGPARRPLRPFADAPDVDAETPGTGDDGEQAGEALRDFLANQKPAQPEIVVRDAVRLVTGLVHDLPDARSVRAALSSDGIPVQLGRAPDLVALEGDEWIRSLGWPVRDGRLYGPSSPADLVLDVVRLGEPREPTRRRLLGMALLPASAADRPSRLLDWRTDEQIMDDAANVAALVRGAAAPGGIDGLGEVLAKLEALAAPSLSPHETFRLRRLLEVAEKQGALPFGFVSALPGIEKLQPLIDGEIAERRRVLLAALDAEIDAERARRSHAIEGLRIELADAERAVALLRAREEAYHRTADELKVEISDRIERRVAELTAASEGRLRADVERHRAGRGRLEELAARVERVEAASVENEQTARERAADAIREALRDERTIGVLVDRVAEALPRDGRTFTDAGGAAHALGPLINDPADAVASLRWHAHDNGVDDKALHTAFSIASVGLTPVFVGAKAGAAATALANAVGGPDFSTLHCDPTLIAPADLLDPKRARTDAVLLAIEAARRHPERWHAVALRSIDWAPCAYWLPALGCGRSGFQELPRNLLLVGATAVDGPRTHVPLGALRDAVPIDAAKWSGRNGARRIAGAWSTAGGACPGEPGEGWADYLERTMGCLDANLSAESLKLVVGGAKTGRERLLWTVEDACASLPFVAEWLSAARDGGTPSLNVGAVLNKLAPEEEV